MPYTPTEWSRGDVVTSEKLNKLEQGVAEAGGGSGGGFLKVGIDDEDALDKTWKEIHDALLAGYYVVISFEPITGIVATNRIILTNQTENSYEVTAAEIAQDGNLAFITYATDSENGYPVLKQD